MSNRKFKRNEQHHWWPMALSMHWTNQSGQLHRIHPDGKMITPTPHNTASIGGGHNSDFRVPTPWNQSFEEEFEKADNAFPKVVEALNLIPEKHKSASEICHLGYRPARVTESFSSLLSECVASLIIRSPRFRAQSGERKFHATDDDERKLKTHSEIIVASIMRGKQAMLTKRLIRSSRVLFLFTEGKKFIFGDGFYSTISPYKLDDSSSARINAFIPILPTIALFFTDAPARLESEFKFLSLELDDEDVVEFNNITQTYSESQLYYCDKAPTLTESFKSESFREYGRNDPFEEFIKTIPEMQNDPRAFRVRRFRSLNPLD